MDAALERARAQVEELAQATAELEATIPAKVEDGPVLISSEAGALADTLEPTAVHDLMLSHLFDEHVRAYGLPDEGTL